MRLRQIEIFYHVYREGSISNAARVLYVSQPSVSKVLRHAEDQLGFDLFIRSKGRLEPTPEAHELYDEIKDIYQRISSFNRTAGNIKKRKGGHIRFGVLPSLSLSVAPEAISSLRVAHPDLTFELTTLHSGELVDAIIEKKCDICLGFESYEDERIEANNIGHGHLALVANAELEDRTTIEDLSVLDGADFIGLKDSGPLGILLSSHLEQRHIQPNEVVTAHTYHVALALVRNGLGLAITDNFTAESHLGLGLSKYSLMDMAQFPVVAMTLASPNHQQAKLLQICVSELRKRLCQTVAK